MPNRLRGGLFAENMALGAIVGGRPHYVLGGGDLRRPPIAGLSPLTESPHKQGLLHP